MNNSIQIKSDTDPTTPGMEIQDQQKLYEPPRVILELELETQVGSPLLPTDPFDLLNP